MNKIKLELMNVEPVVKCTGLTISSGGKKYIYSFADGLSRFVVDYINSSSKELTINIVKSGQSKKGTNWNYVELCIKGIVIDKGYLYELN